MPRMARAHRHRFRGSYRRCSRRLPSRSRMGCRNRRKPWAIAADVAATRTPATKISFFMAAPPRFMLLGQRPGRGSVRSQAFVLSKFFRREKCMQIISLQDGTQLAKWNSDQNGTVIRLPPARGRSGRKLKYQPRFIYAWQRPQAAAAVLRRTRQRARCDRSNRRQSRDAAARPNHRD
jgi:hypothetical protein